MTAAAQRGPCKNGFYGATDAHAQRHAHMVGREETCASTCWNVRQ
ncbi:hypothetical protein K788_0003151 [Paraburkholderia caribensis MBA4]|uniref:Uncharacterized protein n=1 Tax=Paraburkholderia caribensis MBA4 TaxID=1323664 RepID=A0A0P0REU8_9BURK|nr:hypothetical protein K788_0003151 [Paraburkholderia caribensis MBA4]